MKKIAIICIYAFTCLAVQAQIGSSTGVSQPKAYRISKESKPPVLDIVKGSIEFVDATGNQAIDANERCYIRLQVANSGTGDAYGCIARTSTNGTTAGISCPDISLKVLKAGTTQTIEIPVTTGMKTENGQVEFAVQIDEPKGFGTDPQYIRVKTQAFDPPQLQVTDFTVTGVTARLTKKRPFDLQVLLQNTKYGRAENVRVEIDLPANVILVDGQQTQEFASLEGGKTQSLVYSLITNNNYSDTTIPITIRVREKYGCYAEDRTISLAFDQTLSSSKITVDAVSEQRDRIILASLGSDVDKDIPLSTASNPNTFAVIIANENYRRESQVAYALSDGEIFRKYCIQTLGLPEKNVRYYPDATFNEIRAGINWLGNVAEAYSGKAKVIFYYAGHGIPDEHNAAAYLLPTDGYGADVQTGYKLGTLYRKLALLPAESVVVFMDACFSGAGRTGQMLASTRGVAIKARQEVPSGNMVVFSAAQSDETAYPYLEKSHGMFTYFLLKKLQDTDGLATLGELGDYIIENVRQRSIIDNSKSQTPTVIPSAAINDSWQSMRLR